MYTIKQSFTTANGKHYAAKDHIPEHEYILLTDEEKGWCFKSYI